MPIKLDFSGFPITGGANNVKSMTSSSGIAINEVIERASERDYKKISSIKDNISLGSEKISELYKFIDLLSDFNTVISDCILSIGCSKFDISNEGYLDIELLNDFLEPQSFNIYKIKTTVPQSTPSVLLDLTKPIIQDSFLNIMSQNALDINFVSQAKLISGLELSIFIEDIINIPESLVGSFDGHIKDIYTEINDENIIIKVLFDDVIYSSDSISINNSKPYDEIRFSSEKDSFVIVQKTFGVDTNNFIKVLEDDFGSIVIKKIFSFSGENYSITLDEENSSLGAFLIDCNAMKMTCSLNSKIYEGIFNDINEEILLENNESFISIKKNDGVINLSSFEECALFERELNKDIGFDVASMTLYASDDIYMINSKFNSCDNISSIILKKTDNKGILLIKSNSNISIFDHGMDFLDKSKQIRYQPSEINFEGITIYSNDDILNISDDIKMYLKADTEAVIRVVISRDYHKLIENLNRVIDSYNKIIEFFNKHKERDFNNNLVESAILWDSPSLLSAIQGLRSELFCGRQISSDFSLNELGISSNGGDNMLKLNNNLFMKNITRNTESLKKKLIEVISFVDSIKSMSGPIKHEINSMSRRLSSYDIDLNRINASIEQKKLTLNNQLSKIEEEVATANQALWFMDTILNQDN